MSNKNSRKKNNLRVTKNKSSQHEITADRLESAATMNWVKWFIVGTLSIASLVSLYLSYGSFTATELALCGNESDCGIVQRSQWGSLLGLPVAFWGLLLNGVVIYFLLSSRDIKQHLKKVVYLLGFASLYQVYLTSISLFVIGATCVYCLTTSVLLWLAFVAATTTFVRQEKKPTLIMPLVTALILIAAVHVTLYTDILSGEENPSLRALAVHLQDTGATFYGAFWCPACAQQKKLFANSVKRLPYVECSPGGRGAPQSVECLKANITNYPTWVIDGQRHIGVQSIETLSTLSQFKQPIASNH